MKTRSPRYLATSIGLTFALSGCAGPVAPDALAPAPQAATGSRLDSNPMALLTPARVITTFPLLSGTFTLSLRAADGSAGTIKGTYTGRAVAKVPGNTTATLDLHITETSGVGSAVTGLQAEGS